MGNVPISCCRSKSPRLSQDRSGNFGSQSYSSGSTTNHTQYEPKRKLSSKSSRHGEPNSPTFLHQGVSSNILQHISEREPDDSETDPSLNPLNKPIFASRSLSTKLNTSNIGGGNTGSGNKFGASCGNYFADSYSSSNNSFRKQSSNTPLSCSHDQGYNSGASTNLNLTNSSFESGIQKSTASSQHNQPANQLGKVDHIDALASLQQSTGNSSFSDDNNKQQLGSELTNSERKNANTDLAQALSYHQDDTGFQRPSSNIYNSGYLRINEQSGVAEQCQKASSCSTIFMDCSTISQPDFDQTIKCVSLAIYYHIRNRTSENLCDIFDESIHPLKMPASLSTSQQPQPGGQFGTTPSTSLPGNGELGRPSNEQLITLDSNPQDSQEEHLKRLDEPDQKTIYEFVRTLFKAAQLTSEYAITTLVYLERLMTYAEIDLTPRTWRRMFLGAILLSSKVWEDQAVWNVDYAQILEEISVDDINELERQFLELIQFNMNVPSSVYAKYYFSLRTLALRNGLHEEQTLLNVNKARQLEAKSNIYSTDDWLSSPIHRKSPPPLKKHTSLEKLRLGGFSRAVLM